VNEYELKKWLKNPEVLAQLTKCWNC